MKKHTAMCLELAALSHQGLVRTNNEDNLCFVGQTLEKDHGEMPPRSIRVRDLDAGCLAGVFDGMGGHACGELASWLMATEAAGWTAPVGQSAAAGALADLCRRANEAVCARMRASGSRIGSTASMLFFRGDMVWHCNVGDSPIFRLRDGVLSPLYTEHTERAMFQRLYGSEAAEGRKFPLTQHIGIFPEEAVLEPAVGEEPVREGDVYLICSDGLTDMVSKETIAASLGSGAAPEQIAGRLKDAALAGGGADNVTAIVIRATEMTAKDRLAAVYCRLKGGDGRTAGARSPANAEKAWQQ